MPMTSAIAVAPPTFPGNNTNLESGYLDSGPICNTSTPGRICQGTKDLIIPKPLVVTFDDVIPPLDTIYRG